MRLGLFLAGRAGYGKACRTVWPPDAECSDFPRSGGALRVSVCFVPAHAGRLRPGVAGPSCQGKGWQEQGSVVPGHWRYSALAQAQRFPQRTIRPLSAEESPSASCCFCLRRNTFSQRSGPRAGLHTPGPVPRILRRRSFASPRRHINKEWKP